jgi:hypothetical protein
LYFLLNFDLSSWPLISLWGTRIVKLGLRIKIHYAIAKNILDFRNAEAYLYKSFKTSGPSLIVLIGLLPYYNRTYAKTPYIAHNNFDELHALSRAIA